MIPSSCFRRKLTLIIFRHAHHLVLSEIKLSYHLGLKWCRPQLFSHLMRPGFPMMSFWSPLNPASPKWYLSGGCLSTKSPPYFVRGILISLKVPFLSLPIPIATWPSLYFIIYLPICAKPWTTISLLYAIYISAEYTPPKTSAVAATQIAPPLEVLIVNAANAL